MKHKKSDEPTEEDLKGENVIVNKAEAIATIKGCDISESDMAFAIQKIDENKAVVAVTEQNILIGFFYNTVLGNGEITRAYKVYRIMRLNK